MTSPADQSGEGTTGQTQATNVGESETGEGAYVSISAALEAGVYNIKLTSNLTENITIKNGQTVTIDLNGKTITNPTTDPNAEVATDSEVEGTPSGALEDDEDGAGDTWSPSDTITVEAGGTLNLTGNGTVKNLSNGCSVITNSGSVVIDCAVLFQDLSPDDIAESTDEESEPDVGDEDQTLVEESKGFTPLATSNSHNSVVTNLGTMIINDGAVTSTVDVYPLILNGAASEEVVVTEALEGAEESGATLTIKDGSFVGGSCVFSDTSESRNVLVSGGSFVGQDKVAAAGAKGLTVEKGVFEADPAEFIADTSLGTKAEVTPNSAIIHFTVGEKIKWLRPGYTIVWQPVEASAESDGKGATEEETPVQDGQEGGEETPSETTPSTSTNPVVTTSAGQFTVLENEGGEDANAPSTSTYEAATWTATASGYTSASGTIEAKPARAGSRMTEPLEVSLSPISYADDTTTTETIANADGTTTVKVTDAAGTVTETTVAGDVTTVKVTDAAGAATTTVTDAASGVSAQVTQDAAGATTGVSATIPAAAEGEGEGAGEGSASAAAVTLPVTITPASSAEAAAPCTITVEGSAARTVEIPVSGSADTTVAAIVGEDGTTQIIKLAGATDAGLLLNLEGTSQLKIYDNAKAFADADANSWYAQAVAYVSAHEIMNGNGGLGATEFAPDQVLSRGMMTEILYNLDNAAAEAGEGTVADGEGFADTADQWFDTSANWALKAGITTGYADGSFGGNDSITREQAVTMLWRYAGQPAAAADDAEGGEGGTGVAAVDAFADGSAVSEFAQTAMNWAVEQGIVSGKGGTELAPGDTATRAEVAAMAMRFCKLM